MKRFFQLTLGVTMVVTLLYPFSGCDEPLGTELEKAIERVVKEDSNFCLVRVYTSGGGNVTPTGIAEYKLGDPVYLIADPNQGCTFLEWTVSSGVADIADVTSERTTLYPQGDSVEVRGQFASSLVIENSEGGMTIPSGTIVDIPIGDLIDVRAEPDDEYVFQQWSILKGDPIIEPQSSPGGENRINITLTEGPAKISADFNVKLFELTVLPVGTAFLLPAARIEPYTLESGVLFDIQVQSVENGHFFNGWKRIAGSENITIVEEQPDYFRVRLIGGSATIEPKIEDFIRVIVRYVDVGDYLIVWEILDDFIPCDPAEVVVLESAEKYQTFSEIATFDRWQVVRGNVTIADSQNENTTATVVSGDHLGRVEIEAIYTFKSTLPTFP